MKIGHKVWPSVFFALLLLSITLTLWYTLKTQENNAIAETVSQELIWGKEAIVNQTNYYIMTSQRMARRWEYYGNLHSEEWEYDARYYLDQSPGLVAMGWMDASDHTRYTVAFGEKEMTGNLYLSLKADQPDVFEAAKRVRGPQFSGLIHLKEGGIRAFLVCPLFTKDQFHGFLVDVFDVGFAFGSVLKTSVDQGWVYQLSDGQSEVQTSGARVSPGLEKFSKVTSFQIPGVPITLKVIPSPAVLAKLRSKLPEVALIVGLVLTGLFTWGARTAQLIKVKSEELRDATVLLRQIREAMDSSAIISMTDLHGTITYVNDNFCKISKYSREEILGQNHRIIKSGLHPREYYVDMWRTIARGKIWKGEFCNKAKDGSLYWVYATIFSFMSADGKPESYMGIRHDITDRKMVETILAKQTEELQRSNRTLEEFDHVVAHELKTPLTVIKLAAENMTSAGLGPLNKMQEGVLLMIDRNVDLMAETINGLLRLAQINAKGDGSAVHTLDTRRHIDRVIENLKAVAREKNVVIRDEVPEGFPAVKSSPGLFAEVLTNILNNAIRYASHEVAVGAQSLPGWVQFSVRDDGPGIPKEQLAHLFEKFASDNKQHTPLFKGTGLGLYICKDILQQMGGKIWAESNEGRGASFYFTLPKGDGDPSVS